MSTTNESKLIAIPVTLRLEVPANLSEDDIKKLVANLTVGDFGIYPDDRTGSLKEEVKDHIESNGDDEDTLRLTSQIKDVDLWAESDNYTIIEL